MNKIRLDKFICDFTKFSRSQVKELVKNGKVKVDGIITKKIDVKISPDVNKVETPLGEIIYKKYTYIILNKPEGYVCSTSDRDNKTVLDLVPQELQVKGLFPAGRLDKDTTGMVLLTDDGELAHNILSPKHHITKYYIVKLAKPFEVEYIDIFTKGIVLQNGEKCQPAKVKPLESSQNWALIEICEGKYHQIKRMFASVENHVEKLSRICMGSLKIPEELGLGQCIELMHKDVEKLKCNPNFDEFYKDFSVHFSSYLINKYK